MMNYENPNHKSATIAGCNKMYFQKMSRRGSSSWLPKGIIFV